jgi:hypothetical protein
MIRTREVMATTSTLSEDKWNQLKRQTVETSSGFESSAQEETTTLYVAGNPRKMKGLPQGDALVHTGVPQFIHIDESDVLIDLANPVAFIVEHW